MTTRRLILHLIVGLLTFLIGVTAAIALGGFDPLERLMHRRGRQQLTIPPQPLINAPYTTTERSRSCQSLRMRTAELSYRDYSVNPPTPPPAPVAPDVPLIEEYDAPPAPPTPPRAPRPRH